MSKVLRSGMGGWGCSGVGDGSGGRDAVGVVSLFRYRKRWTLCAFPSSFMSVATTAFPGNSRSVFIPPLSLSSPLQFFFLDNVRRAETHSAFLSFSVRPCLAPSYLLRAVAEGMGRSSHSLTCKFFHWSELKTGVDTWPKLSSSDSVAWESEETRDHMVSKRGRVQAWDV